MDLVLTSVSIGEFLLELTILLLLVFDFHLCPVTRCLEVLDASVDFFSLLDPVLPLFVEKLLVDIQVAVLDTDLPLVVQLTNQRLHRVVGKLTHVDILIVVSFVFLEGLFKAFLQKLDVMALFHIEALTCFRWVIGGLYEANLLVLCS